jgi:poly(hydroxyalkanoate) granule-associated protein
MVAKAAAAARDAAAGPMAFADRAWFAGLGAMALARTEGAKVLTMLVEEGECLEKKGLSPVGFAERASGAIGRVASGAKGLVEQFQDALDARIAAALHRLGLPTREEIAVLSKRIDELAASIETLRARR